MEPAGHYWDHREARWVRYVAPAPEPGPAPDASQVPAQAEPVEQQAEADVRSG